MKELTAAELRQTALNKQHFGKHDQLFACTDGSMYVKEEDAKTHVNHKNHKYHMQISYVPIFKDSKTKEEKAQEEAAKKLIEEEEFKRLEEQEEAKKAEKNK